ncbi:hypothetical protein [Candidatus Phyllobacterium onerii]|uniref:hypothetical protein n=1 Tax=Candidatus Phyllobacterium onerii TaxID=3020828 RepID=UPI00232AB41F|nr:hypothetical protein [Phyllobacterium sp. IY22]
MVNVRPEYFEGEGRRLKGTLTGLNKRLRISTAILKLSNVELRDVMSNYLKTYTTPLV